MSFKMFAIAGAALCLAASARAERVTVIDSFSDTQEEVGVPYVDGAGDVFGTILSDGTFGCGTVFVLAPDGTRTVRYDFTGGGDGCYPFGGVIEDAAGNLYGTARDGGAGGGGTLYKLAPDGTFTTLHAFVAYGSDANTPYGSIAMDAAGNLYGTGSKGGASQYGAVYEYAADGTYSLLHSFAGADGEVPTGLILARDGALYGTTVVGGRDLNGKNGGGVVYRLTTGGAYTILHAFDMKKESYWPQSELAVDARGNVYGTTHDGGGANAYGGVFRIGPNGKETVLHTFFSGGTDGVHPGGRVALDDAGNVYGTTIDGGYIRKGCRDTTGCGVLFRVAPDGSETILQYFNGRKAGGDPVSGVVSDGHGRFYGAVIHGGGEGWGGLFRLN